MNILSASLLTLYIQLVELFVVLVCTFLIDWVNALPMEGLPILATALCCLEALYGLSLRLLIGSVSVLFRGKSSETPRLSRDRLVFYFNHSSVLIGIGQHRFQ